MSLDDLAYIAVDLGAGSGRVFLGSVANQGPALEQVARFHYSPRVEQGHLRWDFPSIMREIRAGLRASAGRAREKGRRIASVGVDSWGVDYGLVDRHGRLLENPICYRDARTEGAMAQVFARVPRDEIFARTGIQFLPFNTLFQLYAHSASGIPADAARLLLIPDLVTAALTGRAVTEFTNATTTQMLHAGTGTWDTQLLDRLGLPSRLCGDIIQAGELVASMTAEIGVETGLDDVPVVAVATHDTASAVAGSALEEGWAYISSGTWSLVGTEIAHPLITEAVARQNFTNEGGAFATTRFLKNVMGLWILESCRAEWDRAGIDAGHLRLIERVAALDGPTGVIFPDDPRFLRPPSMLDAIAAQMRETGQSPPDDPPAIAKVVLDSLAFRYASVVGSIPPLTGHRLRGLRIVGGGSQNAYLNQATATATGLPVVAGPVEATALGNVLVQAIAAGRFESLAAARRQAASGLESAPFTPRPTAAWREAAGRYAALESRFGATD